MLLVMECGVVDLDTDSDLALALAQLVKCPSLLNISCRREDCGAAWRRIIRKIISHPLAAAGVQGVKITLPGSPRSVRPEVADQLRRLVRELKNLTEFVAEAHNFITISELLPCMPILQKVSVSVSEQEGSASLVAALSELELLQELSIRADCMHGTEDVVSALAAGCPYRRLPLLSLYVPFGQPHNISTLSAVARRWCSWRLAWFHSYACFDADRFVREVPGVAHFEISNPSGTNSFAPQTLALLQQRRQLAAQLALVCGGLRAQPRLPPELHQLIFEEFAQ